MIIRYYEGMTQKFKIETTHEEVLVVARIFCNEFLVPAMQEYLKKSEPEKKEEPPKSWKEEKHAW